MLPPLYRLCAESSEVALKLGPGAERLYPFGEAPQGVRAPYATWQVISGAPENCLGGEPDVDGYVVQVDVWADVVSDAIESAKAIRDALQRDANVVAWRGTTRDPETKLYRYSFDVAFVTPR